MKCINTDEIEFLNSKRPALLQKRTNSNLFSKSLSNISRKHIDQIYDANLNRKFYFYQDIDEEKLTNIRNSMRRSVKEFSYFDWSQVKLNENDYERDQLNNVNIFSDKRSRADESDGHHHHHRNLLSNSLLMAKMAANNRLLNSSSKTAKIASLSSSSEEKKFKGLPQILTIRFS